MSDMEIRCVICAENASDTLFVSGPSITICAKCILSAVSLLLRGNLATAELMPPCSRQTTLHCSFCGRLSSDTPGLVGYGGVALCSECLGKSVELMASRAFERTERRLPFAIPPHGP